MPPKTRWFGSLFRDLAGKFSGESMSEKYKIAFLGIGLMGAPMARRLLGAGFEVTVWNRRSAKAEALASDGAIVAANAAEAVAAADIVITMVSDGSAVGELLFDLGVAGAMQKRAVVVDMSSIKPKEAREHADKLKKIGVSHIDAPVSGGTGGAADGTLAIMAGGAADVFEKLGEVFAPMGRVILIGPSGAGQLAKLANQAIVAINIGGVAEALLLASGGGANPAKVREALTGGFADSKILDVHGQRMLERNFIPGGQIAIHIKDLNNILEAASESGVDMPLAKDMLSLFEFVRDKLDGGKFDHSGALLGLEAKSSPNRVGTGADQLPK